jgi:hypothetical protein
MAEYKAGKIGLEQAKRTDSKIINHRHCVNGIDTIENMKKNRSKPVNHIDIILHIDISDLTSYRYLTLVFRPFDALVQFENAL